MMKLIVVTIPEGMVNWNENKKTVPMNGFVNLVKSIIINE